VEHSDLMLQNSFLEQQNQLNTYNDVAGSPRSGGGFLDNDQVFPYLETSEIFKFTNFSTDLNLSKP